MNFSYAVVASRPAGEAWRYVFKKMNDKQKVARVTILSIFILVICGYLGAKHLHKTSPIFNFFFSSGDLYSPLACTEFDLSEKHNYQLEFTNKYPGNHKLEVLVERPTEILEKYNTVFKMRVVISAGGKILKNTVVSEENIWPFWGVKKDSGFSIYTYKVPTDLPQGKLLKATIQIEESDESFNAKYGKQHLCFSKYSDE